MQSPVAPGPAAIAPAGVSSPRGRRLRDRARRLLHGPAAPTSWPATPPWRVRPNLALVCVMIYMFVVHSGRLPIAQEMIAAGLLATLLLPGRLRFPPPLLWFGGYLLWCAVTAVLSPWSAMSIGATYELGKIWLIAFLAANVIRTRGEFRLFMLVWVGLFGLFPLRGTLMNYIGGYQEFGRYFWNFLFGNPNDLASFCILQIGICIGLLRVERVTWIRICAGLGAASLTFVVIITQSRGGMLALGTLAVVAFIQQRRKLRALAVVALAGLVVVVAAPEKVFNRLGGLTALAGGAEHVAEVDPEQSAASRYAIWRVGMHIFAANPLTGAGWGTFPTAHALYQREVPNLPPGATGPRDAHGTYVKLLAETGLPGFLLFAGMILSARSIVRKSIRRIRETAPGSEGFLVAMMSGQLAYLQACLFASYQHLPFLYIFTMAMVTGAALFERLPETAAVRAPRGRARLQPAPGPAFHAAPPHLPRS